MVKDAPAALESQRRVSGEMLLWAWPWGLRLVGRKLLLGDIDAILVLCIYFVSFVFFLGSSVSFHCTAHLLCWVFGFPWEVEVTGVAAKSCLFLNRAHLRRNNKQIPRKQISTVLKKLHLKCVFGCFFFFSLWGKMILPCVGAGYGRQGFSVEGVGAARVCHQE